MRYVIAALLCLFATFALAENSTLTINLDFPSPVGDFSSTSGDEAGYAQTGFGFGLDYTKQVKNNYHWGVTMLLDANPYDDSDLKKEIPSAKVSSTSWSTFWLMMKGGISHKLSDAVEGNGNIFLGLMRSATPEITAETTTQKLILTSANGSSLAYGLGGNIIIKNHWNIGLAYMYGEPEFTMENLDGSTDKYKQHTSLVHILIGYRFNL